MKRIIALLMLVSAMPLAGQVTIELAPSGGFVGFERAAIDVRPSFDCADGVCTEVPNFVDVRPTLKRVWGFAASAGIVGKFLFLGDETEGADRIGLGVQAQIVFVPTANGSTPLPGASVYFGNAELGVSAGIVWGAGDRILVDDEVIRAPSSSVPDLAFAEGGGPVSLFFGIRLGGKTLSGGNGGP